jgi:three-Cys-motif partner protein
MPKQRPKSPSQKLTEGQRSIPQEKLFDIGHAGPVEPEIKPLRYPVWTENKARLIERYLYYFVLVTKHGTYIDGFAGPQEAEKPEMWAAKLVLESQPRWLRHFHLFEKNALQLKALESLKAEQHPRTKREPKRDISIYPGDFNDRVVDLLSSGKVTATEATFCLLDQRTFECKWATVETLARHKTARHKIELFYFLPIGWLDRALAAQRDTAVLASWWGRDDWNALRPIDARARADRFVSRLRGDFDYRSVKAWPIYERASGGRVMYYMIHCTDHEEAPVLMARAYDRAVQPKEPAEQLFLDLGMV